MCSTVAMAWMGGSGGGSRQPEALSVLLRIGTAAGSPDQPVWYVTRRMSAGAKGLAWPWPSNLMTPEWSPGPRAMDRGVALKSPTADSGAMGRVIECDGRM